MNERYVDSDVRCLEQLFRQFESGGTFESWGGAGETEQVQRSARGASHDSGS
jgi:hypothetical protein